VLYRTTKMEDVEFYDVTCDMCTYAEQFESEFGFKDILQQMQGVGWLSKYIDGEWQHYCAECKIKL